MYLAIGINFEHGFVLSELSDSHDRTEVEKMLTDKMGEEPDSILLVDVLRSDGTPFVLDHWQNE